MIELMEINEIICVDISLVRLRKELLQCVETRRGLYLVGFCLY